MLLLALVFAIMFALLGLGAGRTALIEARLAGRLRAHVQTLAAAELALRECEARLPAFNTAQPGMYDSGERVPTDMRWLSVNWNNAAAVHVVSGNITGLSEASACLVEQLDAGRYRVTARTGAVFLQSHWKGDDAGNGRTAWAELGDE